MSTNTTFLSVTTTFLAKILTSLKEVSYPRLDIVILNMRKPPVDSGHVRHLSGKGCRSSGEETTQP